MSDFVILLLTISVCGTIMFFLITLINSINFKLKMQWIYLIMKLLILFFAFPAVFIMVAIFNSNFSIEKIKILGDDITNAVIIKNKNFSTILYDGIGNSSVFLIIIIVWLVGFITLYLLSIIKEKLTLQKLKKSSTLCNDEKIKQIISDTMSKLNIKRRETIPVYTNQFIETPFITGFGSKTIIFLPQKNYTPQLLLLFLEHELIHYKHCDLIFKMLMTLITGIHWFNPFIRYIAHIFFECCECACDEKLLEEKSIEVRKIYAHAIVNIIVSDLSYTSIGFNDNTSAIKRRLSKIMKANKTYSKRIMFLISLIMLISCPLTIYTTVSASTLIQNVLARKISDFHSLEATYVGMEENSKVQYEQLELKSDIIPYSNVTRGSNFVDVDISGKSQVVMESLKLNKGTTVQIVLGSDTSESFRAGLINTDNLSTYVSSKLGTINYKFNITKTDDYIIFIESTTDNNIHVTGSIYIK